MKIIICTRDLSYGAGSHVKGLLKEYDRNPEVERILLIGPGSLEGFTRRIQFEPIKVIGKFFPTKELFFAIECRRRLVRTLANEKYDLIHTHFPILAKNFGIPLAATFHTTHRELSRVKYERRWVTLASGILHTLCNFFDRRTFKYANKIIFVSQNTKAKVIEQCPDLEGRSVHIPNGVDVSRFRRLPYEERESLKERYKLDNSKLNLLFVGRLEYGKGIQNLIEACKQMLDINLVIVGSGLLAKELRKYNYIRHFESIPNEKMNEIYNVADAYILPSLYENCPTTILEAMACGLPVVSTDVGDVSNMLPEGNLVVPPGNVPELRKAIESIIEVTKSDKDMLERMKLINDEQARQNYSISTVAEMVLDTYRGLLQEP